MPVYIQSKVFAYKGWHPPNFCVYVPIKAPKETEKEQQQQGSKEGDNPTAPQNAILEPSSEGEQTMEDIEEDAHLDEDTIQEQLLPCSLEPGELESKELESREMEPGELELGELEPGELREAVIELDTNEDLPPLESMNMTMNEGGGHHRGDTEDEPLGERTDKGIEAEQVSATEKMETAKKKSKPKKKKTASEEGSQSLGDKVS